MRNDFDSNLAWGQIGEDYIAQWLIQRRGCYVLPVYDKVIHTGKGPVLFTPDGDLVAPDLLVFKPPEWSGETLKKKGRVLWFEAKTKSAFSWHMNTGKWTTGIDLRHYEDYLKVAALSPWPVWLLFLHLGGEAKDTPKGEESPTGLFGEKIEYLADNEHHRSDKWAKGMVYWEHDKLTLIAPLEEVLECGGFIDQEDEP